MKTFKMKLYKFRVKIIGYVILLIIGSIPIIIFKSWACIPFLFLMIMDIYIIMVIINYYKYDRHTIVKIDDKKKLIIYSRKDKYLEISFSEIKRLYVICSPRGVIGPHYYELVLQNYPPIVISYLIISHINSLGTVKTESICGHNLFISDERLHF